MTKNNATTELANVETGEIVSTDAVDVIDGATLANELASLNSGAPSGVVSSLKVESFEDKLAVMSAMTDSKAIADHLGQKIMVKDIIVQTVMMKNEETEQIQPQPRVILIDKDGKAYHAISSTLFRSVKDWYGVLGHPSTWGGALPVTITREGSGSRKYFEAKVSAS